jgi:hypothetical protein
MAMMALVSFPGSVFYPSWWLPEEAFPVVVFYPGQSKMNISVAVHY